MYQDTMMRLSRKEFYDLVWSTPVTQLAKRYGFSDVGLAKICRRNNIPLPPRGYWAQRKSGKEIPKPSLPQQDTDRAVEINIRPCHAGTKEALSRETSVIRSLSKLTVIPEVQAVLHPLIEQSAKVLASCKPADRGILIPPSGCLDIMVSRERLPRAIRIMDGLIKTLAAMGFEVWVAEESTNVMIHDVSLRICLGEELYRRRLRARDHDLDGYYQFGYSLFEKQPVPSEKLFLAISDLGFYSDGECRLRWRDTESKRLEDCLKSFITGLVKVAVLKKERLSLKEE